MNIKLITNSACDLSIDYIKENNIDVASLMVNLNGEFIPDDLGQSLSHKDFYKAVRKGQYHLLHKLMLELFIICLKSMWKKVMPYFI